MKFSLACFLVFFTLLLSCNNDQTTNKGVKKAGVEIKKSDSLIKKPLSNLKDFYDKKNVAESIMANGITIKWFIKGTGNKLMDGEVVLIEYRLALPDGKIIDGNRHAKLPFIPFMVGYNMQTLGWDLAFTQLKVGDFVKVEIPPHLARGKKGIPGVIPANSPNWLYVKVLARVSPEFNENGIKTWTFKKGVDGESFAGRQNEIEYQAIASTKKNAEVINSYRGKFPLRFVVGQKNTVPGLQKVLAKVKKGQKIYVLLDPNQAYGNAGYLNIVNPGEAIFFNITVKDVRPV